MGRYLVIALVTPLSPLVTQFSPLVTLLSPLTRYQLKESELAALRLQGGQGRIPPDVRAAFERFARQGGGGYSTTLVGGFGGGGGGPHGGASGERLRHTHLRDALQALPHTPTPNRWLGLGSRVRARFED